MSSCQKHSEIINVNTQAGPLQKVQEYLKKQVSESEFRSLSWSNAAYYKKGELLQFISIPLINMSDKAIYVSLKDNNLKANWITIEKNHQNSFSTIKSELLDHSRIGIATINESGFLNTIQVFEHGILVNNIAYTRTAALMYVPASVAGPNLTTLLLASLLGIGEPNFNNGILVDENQFEYLEPDQSGSGGGYELYIDILVQYPDRAEIDLAKYFNCFNNISDNGATYTIKLCTDLPSNDDPDKLIVGLTPGHTYLTIKKTNGSQSVTQSFGFYPESGPLSVFGGPVASEVNDDGDHEYNASIIIGMTQSQFNSVKSLALSYASSNYDLNDFNCADFALDIFNSIRTTPIDIPDSETSIHNYKTTPNGIYSTLKAMKDNNHAEAASIYVGATNSPVSYGPCN